MLNRKTSILIMLGGVLLFYACIPRKNRAASGRNDLIEEDTIEEVEVERVQAMPPSNRMDPEKPVVAKPAMNDSTESSATATNSFLALARSRFNAEATQGDLDAGKAIYYGQCAKCHPWKDAKKFTPEKWEKILTAMSAKAKLDAVQTAQVRLYSLTYQAAP